MAVLDFGSATDVRADLAQADLLYLPLMLDPEYPDVVAFSLSTKLVLNWPAGYRSSTTLERTSPPTTCWLLTTRRSRRRATIPGRSRGRYAMGSIGPKSLLPTRAD